MLFIDHREPGTVIGSISPRIPMQLRQLSVGDYAFPFCVIERKTTTDFLLSWSTGHLDDQLDRMAGFEQSYLLIEGHAVCDESDDTFTLHRILDIASRIAIQYRTKVLFSVNTRQTAHFITALYFRHAHSWEGYRRPRKRIVHLAQYLDISVKKLRKIAAATKDRATLRSIALMSQKGLMSIGGIGNQTVKKINKGLDSTL
jgi:ERCC4-type nuclease